MADTAEALARALRQRPDFQVGADVGYGQTYAPTNFHDLQSQVQDSSSMARAYALARNQHLGAEVGFMKLPEYHSKVYTPNYPAYKGLPRDAYPQTAAVTQDITASSPYARLNVYGPKVMGAEPYGFVGKARVRSDNHENALYNNADVADFRETMKRTANYYGLGLEAPITKNLNLRAEYGRIPHGTDGAHTGDRDISMGLLGLGMKF